MGGSLPAARASAPSADRAHTTHYQQRPPLSLGGDAAGCVCVCALTTDFTAERRGFSVVDQPHATDQQPRTPAFWEIFPEKSFYPDLSPLTERASCHTDRQKSSTAMRVVSRAGDSEARPLQRINET